MEHRKHDVVDVTFAEEASGIRSGKDPEISAFNSPHGTQHFKAGQNRQR